MPECMEYYFMKSIYIFRVESCVFDSIGKTISCTVSADLLAKSSRKNKLTICSIQGFFQNRICCIIYWYRALPCFPINMDDFIFCINILLAQSKNFRQTHPSMKRHICYIMPNKA